jgi:Uncharacterized protein conserved in bacteria (DUF2059)
MAKLARPTSQSYRGEFMINRFLAVIFALAFCLIIALPAHAQDTLTPEKQALIKEFMKLQTTSTNYVALMDQFLAQGLNQSAPLISEALKQEILKARTPPSEQKTNSTKNSEVPSRPLLPDEEKRLKAEADEATERILVRIRAEFPKRVNFGELFDRVGVEIYAKHFSEEEIKELIVLYKSSVAQKLLRLLPQITAEVIPKVQEWITPTFTQMMEEAFAEEKKKFKTK